MLCLDWLDCAHVRHLSFWERILLRSILCCLICIKWIGISIHWNKMRHMILQPIFIYRKVEEKLTTILQSNKWLKSMKTFVFQYSRTHPLIISSLVDSWTQISFLIFWLIDLCLQDHLAAFLEQISTHLTPISLKKITFSIKESIPLMVFQSIIIGGISHFLVHFYMDSIETLLPLVIEFLPGLPSQLCLLKIGHSKFGKTSKKVLSI